MSGKRSYHVTGWLILALALIALAPGWSRADATPNDAAMALLDQGELAAAGGDFSKARQLWEAALQRQPDWKVAQRRLAELPARSRDYAAFLEEIKRNQQASLDFVEGISYFNQGRYEEAAKLFRGVGAVLPEHPFVEQYLALALLQARLAGHGSLRLESNTPTKIYLDGQLKGETPLFLEDVPIGEHTLVAECQGVRLQRQVVIRGRSAHTAAFTFNEVDGQ